jgi:hypothetical protein
LKSIESYEFSKKRFGRWFIITDGAFSDPYNAIERIRDHSNCYKSSWHIIGLGEDISTHDCNNTAVAGRGTVTFINQIDRKDLATEISMALSRALRNSLSNCQIKWSDDEYQDYGLKFYNQVMTAYKIIQKKDLEKLKFEFKCDQID